MLTAEMNEELTRVGPGTPMGELLRRYWYPVAFTRELEDFPVTRTRLLGENFALFKTPNGRYGILPEACPHRKASLAYGVVEPDGLRCSYHGWMFDHSGTCLDQPAERDETNFRDRVRADAGAAQEMGGLVWAYIGPAPVPELPRFDVYVMDGVRDVGWAELPCSWLQIMENAVDPHHVEWLHGRYFEFIGRHQGFTAPASFGKKHEKVGFTAFEWGIIKRRVVEGASEEDDDWKIGHPLVFPYNMRVGGGGIEQMQIRVPIDDTTTRFMLYTTHAPDGGVFGDQPTVPDYEIPWRDDNGHHITNYVEGQDIMTWVSQGAIPDRTTEHLGRSDIGVTMLRRMFKEQMKIVADGGDPLGTVREPRERIDLPCEKNKFHAGAGFALDFMSMGSTCFSPQLEELKRLHIDAAARVQPQAAAS
ncbi:MAG: Rieske 2Fe-2S domain-containing protein [Pseudonocardiaceae bacterium]|nr:Rieske 2Fe-2S domain-containing protein [Pseudonocardiaceae bacterium]